MGKDKMMFESQIQRIYLTRLACSFLPALLIGFFVGIVCGNSVALFFIAFLTTEALFILRNILQGLINWAFLFLDEKNAKENIYQILIKNNFPKPSQYEISSSDYFKNIAEKEDLKIEIRLKAAKIFTFLEIPNNNTITRYFLFRVYEKAIIDYRKYLTAEKSEYILNPIISKEIL